MKQMNTALRCAVYVCACALANGTVAQQPDLAAWFPANTRLFATCDELKSVEQKIDETGIGKLWSDPSLESFRSQLKTTDINLGQFLQTNYGFDSSQLLSLAEQSAAIGAIEVKDGTLSLSLIAELDAAKSQQIFDSAKAFLTSKGATLSTSTQLENATVFQNPDGQQVVYLTKGGYLLVSGDTGAAQQILALWNASSTDAQSVKDTEGYQNTVGTLIEKNAAPIRWFFDVVHAAAATERSSREGIKDPANGPFAFRHGIPGLIGIGGTMQIGEDGFDFLNRVKIFAPTREQFLKSFEFFPGDTSSPEYIPETATSQATVLWRVASLLENLEGVVDDLSGEGTWQDMLTSFKQNNGNGHHQIRKQARS